MVFIGQDIKAAALRTLTSIVHLDCRDRTPRLAAIVDVTGVSQYHGFLPVLVRRCIDNMATTKSVKGSTLLLFMFDGFKILTHFLFFIYSIIMTKHFLLYLIWVNLKKRIDFILTYKTFKCVIVLKSFIKIFNLIG